MRESSRIGRYFSDKIARNKINVSRDPDTEENFDVTTKLVVYSECKSAIQMVEKQFVQLLRRSG
ncbi:MAG TPA: hypothetical protein VMZ04_01650 [Anaerolineae bacterium]|nr:hypothetical protein [Anaerolineae bacterium]